MRDAPDLSAVYGLPLRCACDVLLVQRWLDALYSARLLRGACVRAALAPGGRSLVANVVVAEPTSPTRAMLDSVIAGSPARPLVFARLWTVGGSSREELAHALSMPEDDVADALGSLFRLGLVSTHGAAWTACSWARGGEG